MNTYSEDKMYESYSSEVERMQKCIDELQQENKRLKDNAENNDKVVDKVNWENQLLKKKYENAVADYETTMSELQELKKQVEEYENEPLTNKISRIDCVVSKIYSQNKIQQKEFINYLENEIKERKIQIVGYHPTTQLLIEQIIETEKMVLSKFKEIIGDDK